MFIASNSLEWRRGWRVVLASAVGVAVGIPALINSASLFVVPMQAEFGWSRSALAVGPIVGMIYSLLNPLGGFLTDRLGARRVSIAGLCLLSIALFALSALPANRPLFYLVVVALGCIGTVTNNVVYCKAVATWFDRNLGSALALVLTGVSVGGALLQPVLAALIARQGWRSGYMLLAVLPIMVGLPLILAWYREYPRETVNAEREPGVASERGYINSEGAAVRVALADRRFWLIVAAFSGAAIPIGGFVNQMQPLLMTHGYAAGSGAFLVSTFLVMTGIGRLAAGILFDRGAPRFIAAAFLALSSVGAAMLAFSHHGELAWALDAAAVALLGLAQGAEGDFIAFFVLRIFGVRNFSTLFAIVATTAGIGFAAGGFLFSAAYDRRGDYTVAALTSALVLLCSAVWASMIVVPARGERPLQRAR